MKNVFKRNTNVAAVLSSFTTLIDKLEAIAAREVATATDKDATINKMIDEAIEHRAEADRATAAANKIKALIEG